MQTSEEKAAVITKAYCAFVAGSLVGIAAKMETLENNMTEVYLDEGERRTLRHAAHLLFPTSRTEEEFKDEC